ncbi:MAG: MFS transporter [Acetobacteraceae bacterium]
MKVSSETSALPNRDSASSRTSTMSRGLTMLFAIASGMSVANVYFAQPLLDTLAHDFSISRAVVGGVVTSTQVGCALALLLLVPLGDRVDRRRLMAWQLLGLVGVLIVVATAPSTPVLLVGAGRWHARDGHGRKV